MNACVVHRYRTHNTERSSADSKHSTYTHTHAVWHRLTIWYHLKLYRSRLVMPEKEERREDKVSAECI